MPRPVFLAMLLASLAAVATLSHRAGADDPFIVLQSTTSTENSGLFRHILPLFKAKTGLDVRVVAVGSGQALKNAERGDGDVVLVHDKAAEQTFVAQGFGVKRQDVMFNDYVIVGPKQDPARVAGLRDAVEALRRIAAARAPFVSRADESGTHKTELALWKAAGIEVKSARGDWYRATGAGMGSTLNTAAGMGAYALTDRGTWISFGNRGSLEVVVEGDERLFNQYGVILVNPARHATVKAKEGQAFIDWLTGPEGQAAIRDFRIGGEPLFFPNAAVAQRDKCGATR